MVRIVTASMLAVALGACGGASTRAEMPDVASTDRSADELGLPDVEAPEAEPAPDASEGAQ